MPSVLALFFSYLKTALLVMAWAALTLAAYGFIRSSSVAEVVAAAAVSLMLSLIAALLVADLLSPSRPVRRALAVVFTPLLAWLERPGPHAGSKQETYPEPTPRLLGSQGLSPAKDPAPRRARVSTSAVSRWAAPPGGP